MPLLSISIGFESWKKTFEFFKFSMNRMDSLSLSEFKGAIPFVEHPLIFNYHLYDSHVVERNIIGELATRTVPKYENTVRLLRYNNIYFTWATYMLSSNLFAARIVPGLR